MKVAYTQTKFRPVFGSLKGEERGKRGGIHFVFHVDSRYIACGRKKICLRLRDTTIIGLGHFYRVNGCSMLTRDKIAKMKSCTEHRDFTSPLP